MQTEIESLKKEIKTPYATPVSCLQFNTFMGIDSCYLILQRDFFKHISDLYALKCEVSIRLRYIILSLAQKLIVHFKHKEIFLYVDIVQSL